MESLRRGRTLLVGLFAGLAIAYILVTLGFWKVWMGYANTELYNYLWITPFIWLLVFYLAARGIFSVSGMYSGVASIILMVIGIYFYVDAPYSPLIDQELLVGTVLTGSSILILVSGREKLLDALILVFVTVATGLLLVPPPTGWIFDLSAFLTRLLLYMAIPAARAIGASLSYTERGGSLLVTVSSPDGPVHYDIAPVCSGVIGFMSVVAVAPLIIYASLKGSSSVKRRILAGSTGFILLAIGMFLANVVRLALVFYTTWLWGKEIGYNLFHYSPEVVLILPIAYLAVKYVEKIVQGYSFDIPRPSFIGPIRITHIIAFLLIFISIIPISFSYNYSTSNYLFVNIDRGPPRILDRGQGITEDFISTQNTMGLSFKYYGRIHEWEKELNPTTRIHFFRHTFGNNSGRTLDIYVEYSMVGSGIHVWEVCLPWQNISIYNMSWPIFRDPSDRFLQEVWYIRYGKGVFNGVLIYWRDKVYTSRGVEYFRLTVMLNNYYGNITDEDSELVRRIAYNLWLTSLKTSYSIRSIESIGYGYFYRVVLPLSVLAVVVLLWSRVLSMITRFLSVGGG